MSIYKIQIYTTNTGKQYFTEWQNDLDQKAQLIILARIARIRIGNFGDCKLIKNGQGIWELRLDYGPGYRIYFGKSGPTIVLLLIGGDKKSQERDIIKAKKYWLLYKESLDE